MCEEQLEYLIPGVHGDGFRYNSISLENPMYSYALDPFFAVSEVLRFGPILLLC